MKRKPKSSNRNPEFNASVESRIQDCPGLSYMVTEYSHFHTNEWNKQETTSDSKKGAKMIGEGFKTQFGYNLMIAERSNKHLFLLFCYLFSIPWTLIVLFDCNSNKQLCFFVGQLQTFSKLLLTCVTRLSRDFFVRFLSS